MPDEVVIFGLVLPSVDAIWALHETKFKLATETIKIVGAGASFYAVWKLAKIERRYLFRATIPALLGRIVVSLGKLNAWINDPDSNQTQVSEALNHLLADAKSVKKRAKGDAVAAADDLLTALRNMGFERRFWQFGKEQEMSKAVAVRIFGIASRLSRSLENELDEAMWSSK